MGRRAVIMALAWAAVVLAMIPVAHAQEDGRPENLMKACGDKWRAVKEVESAKGTTWPQYLAACRAEASRTRAVRPEVATSRGRSPEAVQAAPPSAMASVPVFPERVSAEFAGESPQRARQKTCSAQFQANKTANANGGLRWVEKGGGYWSKCNAHLKQGRA